MYLHQITTVLDECTDQVKMRTTLPLQRIMRRVKFVPVNTPEATDSCVYIHVLWLLWEENCLSIFSMLSSSSLNTMFKIQKITRTLFRLYKLWYLAPLQSSVLFILFCHLCCLFNRYTSASSHRPWSKCYYIQTWRTAPTEFRKLNFAMFTTQASSFGPRWAIGNIKPSWVAIVLT